MPPSPETVSMAMFCDFENVALGVRDAKYDKFDIKPVLERLLLKGSIVVKKAYCDWERYKGFKATMHEANFELIEIPHVRQSGKNSADIRMVVDALDLCYTKAHVNTFVIVSGDSDFSPLVSKLRENAKYVIGVGIKQSTSDLLIANCDEFIFYDDLVRESQRSAARRDPKAEAPFAKRPPEELEARRSEAIELAASTFDALVVERGDSSRIWASMLKEAIKRRRPDFNESHFGFRAFGNLLEAAQTRGLFELGRDEKSGAYVFRGTAPAAHPEATDAAGLAELKAAADEGGAGRRNRRGGRKGRNASGETPASQETVAAPVQDARPALPAAAPERAPILVPGEGGATPSDGAARRPSARRGRGKAAEKTSERNVVSPAPQGGPDRLEATVTVAVPAALAEEKAPVAKPASKPARNARGKKAVASVEKPVETKAPEAAAPEIAVPKTTAAEAGKPVAAAARRPRTRKAAKPSAASES